MSAFETGARGQASILDMMNLTGERPRYDVPTMEKVRAIPWNGLTAISTFSGCGGSSMGLRYAGWRVPYAVEFIPEAARTYRANAPTTFVDERDVREISGEEILEKLELRKGELDLIDGSPPCSSFSSAGSGSKDWGKSKRYSDSEQRTDDLFFEYVRLIDEIRPRAFIAENVPGLIRGMALEEYAYRITQLMSEHGYRVAVKRLNAAAYGAATARERLIFVGIRRDLGVDPSLPAPTVGMPFTLADGLAVVREDHPEDVAASSMEGYAVGRTWHAWRDARAEGRAPDFRWMPCVRCGERIDGHEVLDQTSGGLITKARCADGERAVLTKDYNLLVVPDLDKPCPTITATGSQTGAASITHPTECRKMTPREVATVSGFPHDFILTGDRGQRYERIGRAVPPPLYKVVGGHIANLLKGQS